MKLQIENQRLRIRIDEDELALLLSGEAIEANTHFADAFAIDYVLATTADNRASVTGHVDGWKISLPHGDMQALAARLPTREGLNYTLEAKQEKHALELLFDVDVRDSARRLKSKKR
jgi:hypothetical protein